MFSVLIYGLRPRYGGSENRVRADGDAPRRGLARRRLTPRKRKQQMATNSGNRHDLTATSAVLRWLLDSDPSIRWQVLRDLTEATAGEVEAECARVATG